MSTAPSSKTILPNHSVLSPIARTLTRLSVASIFALTASTASADRILGIYVGANSWQQAYDGYIQDLDASNPVNVDFEDDLGFDDDNGAVLYVALEHPIPFLPSIQLKHTNIEIEETNTLSRLIDIGGQPFIVNTQVNSEADFSHTDITLYYQILDNIVSLDLGLTGRIFDGFVEVDETSGAASGREDFDAVVPLVYVKARVDLPFTGGFASVSGNIIGANGSMFADYEATVGWEGKFGLGIEGGYRILDLELDDIDGVDAELTIDGAFAGIFYHF